MLGAGSGQLGTGVLGQGVIAVFAIMVSAISLLVDLIYALIDPRVRY